MDIIYKEIKIPNNRFLHSKLIIFRTKDFEYLLSGSANFSSSALRQPSRNGNVEICVLSKLKKGTSNDLIKEVGIIKPIKLDKIKSCVPEEFDQKSRSEFQYRILEALIKGNEIVVKLDKDIKTNEIKLVSGDIEKEYTTKANGKTVVFSIPREDLYLFDNVSALKLKIGNEQSDYKLLYNPSFFPEQYSMLNSLVSDNVDWLFALLNKLSRIPNFSQYTPILDKLDKYGAFDTGADREKILLKLRNKLALVNPYSHTEKIKEVIQRFIIRHKKRVSNAIKYNEYKNAKQVISSFLMINKLILWAVENNYDNIDGLRHIRGNMENFCGEYKKGYLSIMADNDLIELLIDSDLFYHCLLLVFIIDLLQSKSYEIRKSYIDGLHHSPLKRVFEKSNIKCLNKIYITQKKKVVISKLESIKEEYENIVPEIGRYSSETIIQRLNGLIDRVNKYDYKNYSFLDLNKKR